MQEEGSFRSRDDGATWQFTAHRPFQAGASSRSSRIAVAPPPRSETLWVTGSYNRNGPKPAILESTSGGDAWTLRELPGVGSTLAAAFYRGNPDLVYVSIENEILRSYNGGGTWEVVTQISSPQILIDPNDENVLYITSNGIRRSLDAGRTWTLVMDRAWVLADRLSPRGFSSPPRTGGFFGARIGVRPGRERPGRSSGSPMILPFRRAAFSSPRTWGFMRAMTRERPGWIFTTVWAASSSRRSP